MTPQTTVVPTSDPHDVDISVYRDEDTVGHLLTTEPRDPGWLGNPYADLDVEHRQAVAMFPRTLFNELEARPALRNHLGGLKGARLGCDCPYAGEPEPLCHGDVLAAVIDRALVPAGGDG
ncbi:DUF4326 domain-containing protein [Halorientalis brevis]|uniref:DUF4326 domain-containing protein n=1 Tax=Halorientalis brevis TaxID=1126241 RepID=A0ABD6CGH2_9EURY|nr:DUF4326 domain-containing protein [Halorientalis brevis]